MTDPNPTTRMPTPPPDGGATAASDADAPSATPDDAPAATASVDAAEPSPETEVAARGDSPPPPPASAAPPGPPGAPPPAWRPPATRDPGHTASLVFGAILLVLGIWFFLDQTLGIDLPTIRWSQLWPVFLIGLGLWIVLMAMRRGQR
jgi:hypothetical protein